MSIEPKVSTGQIAATLPSAVGVFERAGIDFCCGGHRSLEQAAREAGVPLAPLLQELSEIQERTPLAARNWMEAPLGELLDHILNTHHVYTKEALRRLGPLMSKVVQAHGERHPELLPLRRLLHALLLDLDGHLRKEEQILFPRIRRRAQGGECSGGPGGCGSDLRPPMTVMEMEHDQVAALLREMRELTQSYRLPADACDAYRALYGGLQELERDLHLHIHLENNVLHPRARRLG